MMASFYYFYPNFIICWKYRLFVLFFLIRLTFAANYDCKKACADSWIDKIDREKCVAKCSDKPSLPPKIIYPQVPRNVSISLEVKIYRYFKYIVATVHWDADYDSLREAYYLQFFTKNAYCEQQFPGFYAQDIPPDSTSFQIPNHTPALQPLIIDFGCQYQLEMRSIPYPFGDQAYRNHLDIKVSTCINGFCSCKGQRKPNAPSKLAIESKLNFITKKLVTKVYWEYTYLENNNGTDFIEFRVKFASLLRKANVAPWKKIYRFNKWEKSLKADPNQSEYFVLIPDLIEGNDYKVQVITFNKDYCHGPDIEQEFIVAVKEKNLLKVENTTTSMEFSTVDNNISKVLSIFNDTKEKLDIGEIQPIGDVSHILTIGTNYTSTTEGTSSFTVPVFIAANYSVAVPVPTQFYEPFYTLLPIFGFVCLFITTFIIWKMLLRKSKFIKKQKYLAQLHKNPWTILENGFSRSTVETNVLYINKDILDARAHGLADEFEISYDRITQEKVIGYGAFGCLVYLGTADSINGSAGSTRVAIKQLTVHADERERKEFLSEIAMMKQIPPHPNIVRMYGCCTLFYPHCMVMEYVPYGDLLNYLRVLRKQYEKQVEEYKVSIERDYIMQLDSNGKTKASDGDHDGRISGSPAMHSNCHCINCETCIRIPFVDSDFMTDLTDEHTTMNYLDVEELQSFALQVAAGMAHLESLKITHRDLACRNILVGHGKTLKISDFGLSRVGVYVKTTPGKIPLRWLSIEAMRDNTYSTKSDVWSYGIVLWEICTLGGFPYPAISDNELLRYLECGQRLTKPSSCSERIYELMVKCWTRNSDARPSFFEIKKYLSKLRNDGHIYVEFSPKSSVLPPEAYCRVVPLAIMDEMLCGTVAA